MALPDSSRRFCRWRRSWRGCRSGRVLAIVLVGHGGDCGWYHRVVRDWLADAGCGVTLRAWDRGFLYGAVLLAGAGALLFAAADNKVDELRAVLTVQADQLGRINALCQIAVDGSMTCPAGTMVKP